MIASKLSPDSSLPTLSAIRTPPLPSNRRTSHEPSTPSTVTAYAVPSPSLRQRTTSVGRRKPQETISDAIASRSTGIASRPNLRSGAARVCHGHHTVTPAINVETTAAPADTQAETSIMTTNLHERTIR